MSIAPGSRLGPYEISSVLGEGGMGAVYRARDLKLNRDVAIKVLLPSVAGDPARLARFKREAQLLAALNHPNIAHIYGLEDAPSGSEAFLVMELVEGLTLADRIASGPIPVDDTLPIARQILEALKSAHEQGIVHRDLKPANVTVRADGVVKVLDFGLAKALDPPGSALPSGTASTESPTITSPAMTQTGMILGTAAYMSPEQAKGRPADKSCDVWAFACVLYEMLTARRPFRGENIADTLANVLTTEPSWEFLPKETPDHIRALLQQCLTKDRQHRVADDAVVRFLLDRPIADRSSGSAATIPARRPTILVTAGVAVAVLIGAGTAWIASRPVASNVSRTPTRYRLALPPSVTALINPAGNANGQTVAWSADGRRLVYAARTGSANTDWGLFGRSSDELDSVPIQGAANAIASGNSPFLSPDGEWVGFLSSDSTLSKIPFGGGRPLAICNAAAFAGATWLPDDSIVFSGDLPGLSRVPAAGGKPTTLTTPDGKTEISHRWPEAIPGGKAVLFVVERPGADFNGAAIAVLNLETGGHAIILEGGTAPHYLPSGHLAFVRNGAMWAAPFDVKGLRVTGPAVSLLNDVYEVPPSGAAKLAVASDAGTVAYVSASSLRRQRSLVWVDRRGLTQPLPAPVQAYEMPRLSPDGQRVALGVNNAVDGGDRNIWIYRFDRGTLSRITSEKEEAETPAWSADGTRLTYAATRGSSRLLISKPVDGGGTDQVLATTDHHLHTGSWSPKGDLLVSGSPNPRDASVWLLEKRDQWSLRSYLKTPYQIRGPTLSFDGRWLAYASNDNNRFEIYVQTFPDAHGQFQVSTDGGTEAVWAKRSSELFYRSGDKMMAASIDTRTNAPKIGRPEMLFRGNFENANEAWYDVSADGQRFIMLKPADDGASAGSIVVIQDWMDTVKNLVAARR